MKPCSNQRKLIASLAVDELGGPEARELRRHLQSCEGCRHYLEEISSVTETLAGSQTIPDIEASGAFHRRVVARLQTEEPVSAWETARMFFNLLNWRVALPVVAVSVVLIVAVLVQRQEPNVVIRPLAPIPVQVVSAPEADAVLPPTIANYQVAANQSPQKLDDLLNQQARKALPSAPVYTASMRTLANASQ